MSTRLRTIASVAAIVLLAGLAQAQRVTTPPARALPSDAETLAIIKQRVAEKRSAGMVVGLLDASGAMRVVAYGDAGPGRPALDGDSVFEIGSITKVFTATALASLVLEGKVSLDDPVQKFLPASVKIPSRNGKVITLGNLSSQNSGLPRMPGNFAPKDPANPYADYTVDQLYAFLSAYQLPRDPGEQFEYSNLGVGLLGHVLSLVTGRSYEQLEQQRIWTPLGMSHTAIVFTPWMRQHLALGHDDRGNLVATWDLPTLAGAGAIRSTAKDMLVFAAANLHPERGPLGPAMALAHKERAPASGPMGIGLNWLIRHTGADAIVWHNGGTAGYRSFLGLMPSQQLAVVVLTNSGGAGADDIGFHLLDPANPLTPQAPTPVERRAVEVPVAVLERYVGTYELSPQLSLEVLMKDGVLHVHPTNQPTLRLWSENELNFFLREVDAQITFSRDAQGVATELVLQQGGQTLPGRKIR
jgi:CubicO group peptidase (beta-lactamase class C family)